MSLIHELPGGSILVRAAEAEKLGGGPVSLRMLADSSALNGAASTIVVTLKSGANGANPHHHANSSELFYVISGAVQVLSGDDVSVARTGDFAAVPPGTCHAFAAAPGEDAELLIVITPGVERFEYFRHLGRIARGEVPPESILEVQELYDTWFEQSAAWAALGR